MIIEEMTESECDDALTHTKLGRLACAHENQPYIVPIYFIYEKPYCYAFTTVGQKVEWMRSNPRVCLEVDEIEDTQHWTSVVVFGRFEELPDITIRTESSLHALELLSQKAGWWEPAYASTALRESAQPS